LSQFGEKFTVKKKSINNNHRSQLVKHYINGYLIKVKSPLGWCKTPKAKHRTTQKPKGPCN